MSFADLLLHEFEFFGLEKLFGDALGILLATQAERPQLFAEFGSISIKKARELDL